MDTPPAVEELMIWRGSPSQWLNFRVFLLCGALGLLLLAGIGLAATAGGAPLGGAQIPLIAALSVALLVVLLVAFKRYLDIRCRLYEVSSERVRITRGILSKRSDGLELYRVDDTLLFQPVLLRMVGKGHVQLVTSDRTNPTVMIEAVPEPRWLWDEIRKAVEMCRDRKRTRVIDFEDHQ